MNYLELFPYTRVDIKNSIMLDFCLNKGFATFIAPNVPVSLPTGEVRIFGEKAYEVDYEASKSLPGTLINGRTDYDAGRYPMVYDLLHNRTAERVSIPIEELDTLYNIDPIACQQLAGANFDKELMDAMGRIKIVGDLDCYKEMSNPDNYAPTYYYNTATEAGLTPWSTTTADIIDQARNMCNFKLTQRSPFPANALVMGRTAYSWAKKNTTLLDRFKNVKVGANKTDTMATLLELDMVWEANHTYKPAAGNSYIPIMDEKAVMFYHFQTSCANADERLSRSEFIYDDLTQRNKFRSFTTYIPGYAGSSYGGLNVTDPHYDQNTHSIVSNVLAYNHVCRTGASSDGKQVSAVFIRDITV
jgi:hypothetical protein